MTIEIVKVPDIGSDSAEVTEILVQVGDILEVDDSLAVLESDKASVEVPSPVSGKVSAVKINVGDHIGEGDDLVEVEIVAADAEDPGPEPAEAEPEAEQTGDAETVSASIETVESEQVFQVPDIGSDEADVTEVIVSVGDEIAEGDSIIVAESDKASLEVPAETSGTVVALHVAEGDKVSPGQDLVTLKTTTGSAVAASELSAQTETPAKAQETVTEEVAVTESGPVEFLVPDMGSSEAEIIEVPVAVGDRVEEGDTLAVVETDKASVEVPAEAAGEILELPIAVGGKIAQGDKLVTLKTAGQTQAVSPAPKTEKASPPAKSEQPAQSKPAPASPTPAAAQAPVPASDVHAGPAVRKMARELGVDLRKVKPTGQRGRILKDDVNAYVKQALQKAKSGGATGGAGIPEIPAVDWTQFGEIDTQPMSRINKVTAENMSRNWLNVPHVTQFDDADVTDLEQYRAYLKPEGVARGIKMTPLAFLLRASAIALKENPKFNTAIANGDDLVERKFFHISIAVDTPAGLMVPVIRDVDQKDIWQLALEVSELAMKAKNGKLSPKEMQGASFTISSLGAIGGTGFTPIVPAPQVGILGVSKTAIRPVWDGNTFIPRKLMPLGLSYDHRVVNGADAGKFLTCLVDVLGDLDKIWNG